MISDKMQTPAEIDQTLLFVIFRFQIRINPVKPVCWPRYLSFIFRVYLFGIALFKNQSSSLCISFEYFKDRRLLETTTYMNFKITSYRTT